MDMKNVGSFSEELFFEELLAELPMSSAEGLPNSVSHLIELLFKFIAHRS